MSRITGPLVAALLLVPAAAAAQSDDIRTLTTARRYAGEESLEVHVTFGAGRLRMRSGDEGSLYHARLRYDADAFRPISSYSNGQLRIGLDGMEGLHIRKHSGEEGLLDVSLGTAVPMTLEIAFGAAEADLDLGGMRLRHLEVSTGASDTELRFSRPNPERLRLFEVAVGAASFRVRDLANANVERLHVEGGVGDLVLDFTGDWRGDMEGEIEMGLGSLRLVVPRGLGVRIDKSGFLASFDSQEMTKRGDSYYSQNWESAEHRLSLTIEAAFGSIEVDWVDSATASL